MVVREKNVTSWFSKGGHYDLLTAKASERETPQLLFQLRLLKVEIWWAIACVASLFVWFGNKERPGDDEERYFRFWPRETWNELQKHMETLAAKLLGGLQDVLSPGLHIHDRRSRDHMVTVATLC